MIPAVQNALGKAHRLVDAVRQGDSQVLKVAALAFVFVAVAISVWRSIAHPKGFLRRFASGYVVGIDERQKAMYETPRGEHVGWTQLGVAFVFLVVYGVVPSNYLLGLVALVVIVPPVYLRTRFARRLKKIEDQAHGFALALAYALKATASIGDAVRTATEVTPLPLQQEMRTVLRQVGVGSTIEEALLALSVRSQSSSLDVVVSTLLIGRQTGGDLPRILEGTAASLRELKRLEEFTDKVTKGAKRSVAIAAATFLSLCVFLPRFMTPIYAPLKNTVKGQLFWAQLAVGFMVALFLAYRFSRKSV